MTMRCPLAVSFTLLALACSTPASAQMVTTTEGLTLRQTISQVTLPAGALVGEAIGLATSLEVGTAPFGTSSGGFVFKLDPSTGLQVRTATTFGPAFTERALTSGEGKVSVGVNFNFATFDRLGDLSLDQVQLGSVTARTPAVSRKGLASLVLTSKTVVLSGALGVTDKLDIGVAVPLVSVKVDGVSWVQNGNGDILLTAKGSGISSGLGDIGAFMKYRLLQFGSGQPDPGGIAAMATVRMPTGDKDNLRGLGVTRTMVSAIASAGKGRFRPHANAGYEWWNDGIDVVADFNARTTVTARHQVQYAAGIEFEATPKLTLITDLVARNILGAGRVGFRTTQASTAADLAFGVTSFDSMVPMAEGIKKLTLIPGLKLNLKGNLLLSLNALVSLQDNGLHAKFTPVIGFDLTK
jgi:hypothetical protein